MHKNEKKGLKIISVILLTLLVGISLSGCSNQEDSNGKLEQKVSEEIRFLDTKLLGMINNLNNISMKNYNVVSETATKGENEKSTTDSGASSSDSQSGSDSSSGSSSQGSSGQGTSGGSQNTSTTYKSEPNSILTNNRDPNWNIIKTDIENLYAYWSTIVLDLYEVKIPNDAIVNFSNDLNVAVSVIKAEDKIKSMAALTKLYHYFPEYIKAYSKDTNLVNLMYVKTNVIDAYSFIEEERWNEIKEKLSKAEEYYLTIVNNTTGSKNQYNTNKGYILLKEFQNSVDLHDKDVLYIKYKKLMEELTIMK